ncbi:MAG: AraC family transcriptional regulator [Deltaproteobacteria bacterium]|nr:AraC family transcriptional regulator [Deltaproteobacteria bacterium]
MTQNRRAAEGPLRESARDERVLLRTEDVVLVERNALPEEAGEERSPNDYELTLVRDVECELLSGEDRIHVGKGDLCILHPGRKQRLISSGGEPARLLTLRCARPLVERLLGQDSTRHGESAERGAAPGDPLEGLGPHFPSLSRTAQVAAGLLRELSSPGQPQDRSDVLLINSKILALLGALFAHGARARGILDRKPSASGKREAVAELAESMAGLDLSDMRAEALAERMNLSLRHFTRLFRERTGKSYTDYVTDIRIQRAKQLLVSTDQKLIEIAQAIGYRSLSQFNLIFKRSTSLSPNQYRRQYQSCLR